MLCSNPSGNTSRPWMAVKSPCSHFPVSSECGTNALAGILLEFKQRNWAYLQIKHGSASPHSFADLQIILLSGKVGRALVIWRQNFYIDCSDGWPKERNRKWDQAKKRQRIQKDGKTTCNWEADKGGQVAVKFGRGMKKRREMNWSIF